ncbi:MAG: ABC transporter ATP-binding protein [Magnetococcales bacterium]|nr:ABC transporter ATP-binding protein [Magnetococcales bacterium]
MIKRYPRHEALSGLSFAVAPGTCMALLGHNGAGKTTLMKLLLGLTRPTAGQVRTLGLDPATAPLAFRREIGFLPENVIFHDELSGTDTLHYYARLKGSPLPQCAELLERVGLSEAAGRRVKTYSKGMRQRLGLAQALLGQPRLLLLDEPTTGLDPILRQEFFRIIQELRTQGTTILLSSHVLTELEARTDQVAILRQGKLAAFGTLDELRSQADLRVRMRVATNRSAGEVVRDLDGLTPVPLDDQTLEVLCRVEEKMAVLRHLARLGEVVLDVEIHLPTLDDVYLHFGHQPAEESP